MPRLDRRTIAVVGAGPKGIAVGVKAKVLQEFGFAVDHVVIIEKYGVAAHWSGDHGYTNGEMKLGTSPEKDVVFPLETDVSDEEMNVDIRKRLMDFSWGSFLVQTRRFSDWVDRGRPAPCHQMLASYLKWVSSQLTPQVSIISAEVTCVDFTKDHLGWKLTLKDSVGKTSSFVADGLMLTGPGKPRIDFAQNLRELPQGTYDLESFWSSLKAGRFPKEGKLAIVGAGENAASILLGLAKYAPSLQAEVISPRGFISTRAENYYENRFYSQPKEAGWSSLALSDRVGFMERTDLGVFSTHAMQILNGEIRHRIIPGRVIGLDRYEQDLSLTLEYQNQVSNRSYDHVVLATGFDQTVTLRSLFSSDAIKDIEELLEGPLSSRELAYRIQEDLSVRGIEPKLYLPMLAGLMQGPGFANLSCLGLLSDRIVLGSLERFQELQDVDEFRSNHALAEVAL